MSKAEENSDFERGEAAESAVPVPVEPVWGAPGILRNTAGTADADTGEWFDVEEPFPAFKTPVPRRTGTVLSAGSTALTAKFEAIAGDLDAALICSDLAGLTGDALLHATATIERFAHRLEALQFAAAGEIAARSDHTASALTGLAATKGSSNARELLERLTLVSSKTAGRRIRVGSLVKPALGLTGQDKPSFVCVTGALTDGALGVDSAEVIVTELKKVRARADLNPDLMGDLVAAEEALVALATGTHPEMPVPLSADDLRVLAVHYALHLDPDGDRPSEETAFRQRGFRLGRARDGLIPVSGTLLPEVAGQLQLIFDAYTSPRSAPVAFRPTEEVDAENALEAGDRRTPDQKRHDVFATLLGSAARAAETPSIGGAPPVVLVSVRQQDLEHGTGVGHIDGLDAPVSLRAVKQLVCGGGSQHAVVDARGAIMSLGVPNRIFTGWQRRVITLRDGGCVIPGCHIPASWCEIHHVLPAAEDGPTHTDNGTLLCWFHHATIDTSGWLIRMNRGVPEIKAPEWLDPHGQYRPSTTSGTRLSDMLDYPPD